MVKKNRKVICINGDESKDYEQVIFVMKNDKPAIKPQGRMDFVMEAERIINAKLSAGSKEIHKAQKEAVFRKYDGIQQIVIKNSSGLDLMLNLFVASACIMLACALLYISSGWF